MPSKRKPFNCRPDDETWARIEGLKSRVAEALQLGKITDPILLRLAMIELEKKYPPAPAAEAKAAKVKK